MNRHAPPPAACPHDPARDERKSARLAARELQVDAGAQLVTGFAFAREILRSPAMRQAADIGADHFDLSEPATAPVIFLDGEDHRKKRSAIARFFTPKAVTTQYRAVMEAETERLIAELRARGEGRLDVISFELAVAVAAEIVGLTNSDLPAMSRRLASTFASGTRRTRGPLDRMLSGLSRAAKAFLFLHRDVRPAVRARRAARRDDVISQLLDLGASEKAIVMECLTYASAGMVTTREFIVMAAWHLFDRDDLRARFLESDEAGQLAILEEVLRLEPVAAMVHRRAAEVVSDTVEGPVAEGVHLAIDIRAANTDEAAFGPCPHVVDPDRPKVAGGHLSFGDGPHRCPGAQVAMHESRVFLDRLFRVPGLRLARAPDMLWNSFLMSYELRNAVIACDRG
jgi:cytochrome P450